VGTLLAAVSFVLRSEKIEGAGFLFAVAAAAIITGIIGLIQHFRFAKPAGHAENAAPEELRTYKAYKFEVGESLVSRIGEVDQQLSESLRENSESVDWNAHKKWSEESAQMLTASDTAAAFRARCKAVSVLAKAWNSDRSKIEAFAPNYTPR
jgi:hypothetical protein